METGARRARRERVAYASLDPQKRSCVRTHGSCMFLCMKMCEKSSADCWRHSKVCTTRHAAPFRVIHTCKTLCALSTYTQTLSVNFVHGNGNTQYTCVSYTMMKSVLLRRMPSLNDQSKLKGECTDVKSGCGTTV